jgi:hypothetical protein
VLAIITVELRRGMTHSVPLFAAPHISRFQSLLV